MRVTVAISASVIIAVLLAASPSVASADLWTAHSDSIGAEWNSAAWHDFTLGTKFTVGDTDITVTKLAYADPFDDGLEQDHQVAIWDTSKTELAMVTVPTGTGATLRNGWRWVALDTPITLDANTQYQIGGYTGNPIIDPFQWINVGEPFAGTVGDEIASVDTRQHGYAWECPWDGVTNGIWGNVNMEYVPEPATMTLLGLGSIGLLIRRRRA